MHRMPGGEDGDMRSQEDVLADGHLPHISYGAAVVRVEALPHLDVAPVVAVERRDDNRMVALPEDPGDRTREPLLVRRVHGVERPELQPALVHLIHELRRHPVGHAAGASLVLCHCSSINQLIKATRQSAELKDYNLYQIWLKAIDETIS